MAYGNQTNVYRLGAPLIGEVVDASEEARNANTTENNLFGSVRVAASGGHGIVRNGPMIISPDGGNYKVIMFENKSQGLPTVQGFVNQIYFEVVEGLFWNGLTNNQTHYLYITQIEAGDTNSTLINKKVQTFSNTTGAIPSDGLLVAIIILDEPSNSFIIEDPVGKVNIPVLGNHIVDNQNPHTPFLMQDDLLVSGLTVLDYLRYQFLEAQNFIISGNALVSGNVTILGKLILSGDVRVFGNIVYNSLETQNLLVPGKLIVADLQVSSGLDVYSTSLFRKNIQMVSGTTIDGLDPSLAIPLVNGSNADHLHGHVLGSIAPVKNIFFAPEYCNTVISGDANASGLFTTGRDFNRNLYKWNSVLSGVTYVVTRTMLPADFDKIDRIKITHGVGQVLSGSNITPYVFDKDDTQLQLSPASLQSTTLVTTDISVSGGNLLPNFPMTVVNRMFGASGIGTWLGDMNIRYVPRLGEKILFEWNKIASGNNILDIEEHFDGLRVAPCDLRTEKVLFAQTIALSGSSVFDVNVGNNQIEPTTIFTSVDKPTLNFGDLGSSFVSAEKLINTTITGGQLISSSIEQIASGSRNVNVTLYTYRI
jgi:cytoskeletal protein CcmA (bactofilin family)